MNRLRGAVVGSDSVSARESDESNGSPELPHERHFEYT